MKNYLIGGLIILIAVVLLGYFGYIDIVFPVKLKGTIYPNRVVLTNKDYAYLNHEVATTTQTNMVAIGQSTTTYTFGTQGAEQINVRMTFVASTTSSVLTMYFQTSDNGTNFFNTILATSTDSNISSFQGMNTFNTNDGRTLYTWTPATTATQTRDFVIQNVNSKYFRIGLSSWIASATSTIDSYLWTDAILKQPIQ